MGTIWLNGSTPGYPNIYDALRSRGVNVATYEGWEWRSRSSGGYEQLRGVICHHTASKTSPANDLSYMVNADDGPISSGLLDRTGLFTLIAGGAANHAGKGGGSSSGGGSPWDTSSGPVPPDDANRYVFGIEAANDGVGEPWPKAQTDAYVLLVGALVDIFGFVVASDVRSHNEWTPPRKIDPRGPSPWQPANTSSPWDMNAFRSSVVMATPGPQPEPEDEVTDADIEAIAAKVWSAMIHNYVNGSELPAVSMLGYAHAEAYDGSWAREAVNMINGERQMLADLVRFAHAEAYNANTKCDQIMAKLGITADPTGRIG